MRALSFFFFSGVLFLSSCKQDTVTPSNDVLFGQEWHNTFEKDSDDFYTFTLVRSTRIWGYDTFILQPDGRFTENGLGPADGPETHPGTWTETGKRTYRIRFTDTQRPGYTLLVQLLSNSTLKARRVP